MIQINDGPAADRLLPLARTPILLRITRARLRLHDGSTHESWDGLDQLDDEARPHEEIFLYERIGRATGCFADYVDERGRRVGRTERYAEYRLFTEDPPDDATMRDNARWQAWLERNRDRILADRGDREETD